MSSPLLSRDRMRVFFDGIWSEQRLCHPANVAFGGDKLYATDLDRRHITVIDCDVGAAPFWRAAA